MNSPEGNVRRMSERAKEKINKCDIECLELGCGQHKNSASSIGIDLLDYPDVDIVGDIFESLALIDSGIVNKIYARHFFEHILDFEDLMRECARVLRPGGILHIIVPHFSNPYFYSDYTHQRFFGLYTMSYIADDNIFKRKVPKYSKIDEFVIESVELNFMTPFKWTLRHVMSKIYRIIFNSSVYLQELYEETLSKFVSCYEISYVVRRK